MRYKLLHEMIRFFKSYRQLAGALWLSLYCMKCNRYVIALLSGSDSRRSNSWRDDNDATWRSRCQAGGDGDHDGALEMDIKSTK